MTLKSFGSIRGVVFLLMAVAVVAGLFARIIEAKDFMMLASMAFAAYFSRGRDKTDTTIQ